MAIISAKDILASVENTKLFVKDDFLKNAKLQKRKNGKTLVYSGGFSMVFPMDIGGNTYAFRTWFSSIGEGKERYKAISEYLKKVKLPYFVKFEFVDKGLLVNGNFYPTVSMDWCHGLVLHDYIEKHLSNKQKLNNLADDFLKMVKDLHKKNIAHGDLQHGNILVNDNGQIILIDYDSLYVPALKNFKDEIKGLPDYQHPARHNCKKVNTKLDYFSELIIYLSIKAIAEDPSLWNDFKIKESESLLFKKNDFEITFDTKIYSRLNSMSEDIKLMTKKLIDFCKKDNIEDLEPLEEIIIPTEEKEYNDLIINGDKCFKQKKYGEAKEFFEKSLKIKPKEKYPKEKIKEIEIIRTITFPKKNVYTTLIKKGDECFKQKRYGEAEEFFEKSLKIKPKEKYPKEKIKEIEKASRIKFDNDFEYNTKIKKGDECFKQKKYGEAREFFEESLKIKPNEKYPKEKIKEIEKALRIEFDNNFEYKILIEKGDECFKQKKYGEAKEFFEKSLKIKPKEKYPKEKIEEIEKKNSFKF